MPRLLKVYPSEGAALAAVTRNSAIVLPYLNRPTFISGTWTVLTDKMSEEDAIEVITRNPGKRRRERKGEREGEEEGEEEREQKKKEGEGGSV